YLCNNLGCDRAAFQHRDALVEGMLLDRHAIVQANIDIDTDGVPIAQHFEEASVVDQRSSVSDSRLDNYIRMDLAARLLNADHVFRKLYDRTTEPTESVRVFADPAQRQPKGCNLIKRLFGEEIISLSPVLVDDRKHLVVRVDSNLHVSLISFEVRSIHHLQRATAFRHFIMVASRLRIPRQEDPAGSSDRTALPRFRPDSLDSLRLQW